MNYRRSSLAIGRRTRTDVLKDKAIRKDKDGCDVFEDYWTDSDDDRSSYSSVSTKSVNNINEKEQNISDSGKGDSGSKLEEAKKSPTCRTVESEKNISTSTVAKIPTIKPLKRSQMRKSFIDILSVSKSSRNKNCTLSHDELNANIVTKMQGETINDTKNQSDQNIGDKTTKLDNHASPRNSTMVSKQSDELNFGDASKIEQVKECAVASNAGTADVTHRILKSPKRVSKKHIFDLIDNKTFKDTEFPVLKSVSPLSKVVNETMTLAGKNTKSTFPNPYQNHDDPPGKFRKLNEISEAKIFATSLNSAFNKNANSHKLVGTHKVKMRNTMEIKKILSTYDDYDTHIMQIIGKNNKNDHESSEAENNTKILRKQNKDHSTFNSYENEKESNSESDLSEDVSRAYEEQSDNNINISENVLGNTVLISKPKIDHGNKEREKCKTTLEEESKQIAENNLENDAVKISFKARKQKKPQIAHAKAKSSKGTNLVQVLDNPNLTKSLSPKKNKHLEPFERSELIEQSKSEDDGSFQNTSVPRQKNLKQRVSKYVSDNVTFSKASKNFKELNISKEQSAAAGEVNENYESDQNDQSEQIALKVSKVDVYNSKSVPLQSLSKNKFSKSVERSKQIDEDNNLEYSSSKNTSISEKRKVDRKVSKYISENAVAVSKSRNNDTEQNAMKDKSAISDKVVENYETGVSYAKPVHLSSVKYKKSLKYQERSNQDDENSISEHNTTKNTFLSQNNNIQDENIIVNKTNSEPGISSLKPIALPSEGNTHLDDPMPKKNKKFSKNKKVRKNVIVNKTKSVEDRSAIEQVQENYDMDTSNQFKHLGNINSESSVSSPKFVALSPGDKNDLVSKNGKLNDSKNMSIAQKVHKYVTLNKTKNTKDRSSINQVQVNYDFYTNDQAEHLGTINSEPGVFSHKPITRSSKNTTPKYDPITKNKEKKKASKNKNIPQEVHGNVTIKSVKDGNAVEDMQQKYSSDESDQHDPLAIIDFEPSVSPRKRIRTSYFDKKKSLNSLEGSKRSEENSEDSDVENLSLSKNSTKQLKVKKNRSNVMLLENTVANKPETNVDINSDEDVSDMEIDIGHQSNHSNIKNFPEKGVSFHDALDSLPSKKKTKPKKKHSSTKSKNFTEIRKSNRTRYAPLAHWRNERLRYRFDKETVMILGVDEGTREDNLQIQSLMRQMNRDKAKEKKRRVKKATFYDSVNARTVKLNLVKTFPSVPWDLPANVSGSSAYRIKRSLETSTCAFGYLEIDARSSKPSQYMPEEDLQMIVIKGILEVTIQENNFVVSEKDMFVVPRNTAYSLKNIGNTKALLSYAVGKFKFLEKQHSK